MSLTFKFQSSAVVIVGPFGGSEKDPMKQGLSVLPSCHLSRCFLGIGSFDFPEFWYGDRDPIVPKNGEMGKNSSKVGSFEFKEILKNIEFKLIFTEFVL